MIVINGINSFSVLSEVTNEMIKFYSYYVTSNGTNHVLYRSYAVPSQISPSPSPNDSRRGTSYARKVV